MLILRHKFEIYHHGKLYGNILFFVNTLLVFVEQHCCKNNQLRDMDKLLLFDSIFLVVTLLASIIFDICCCKILSHTLKKISTPLHCYISICLLRIINTIALRTLCLNINLSFKYIFILC